MKKERFTHFIFCALTACGFLLVGASCSKETELSQVVEGVTVAIAVQSDLQTRTSLPFYDGEVSEGNIPGTQHVKDVYLYIYDMDEGGICRACFNVVNWGEGAFPPEMPVNVHYSLSYPFMPGRQYRLVAVGVDGSTNGYPDDSPNSIWTYGLGFPDSGFPWTINVGSRLDEPVRLRPDRTLDDIAHSEFFTGFADFTPMDGGHNNSSIEINLCRRVAGLQVCMQGIPDNVKRVRILLYTSQNTAVPLVPQFSGDNSFADYSPSPFYNEEEGKVLMSSEVQEGSFSMTAFVLPVGVPDSNEYDYTLKAEFITDSGTITKRIRLLQPWRNGNDLRFEDEMDKGARTMDDPDKYLFPIEANHFYYLGTPSNPRDCSDVLNNN